jgi:hypothetical protein
VQDNTCTYRSLSCLHHTTLELENTGCRTRICCSRVTSPHTVCYWNASQLAYISSLVSCVSRDSTYARIIGTIPLFTAPRLPPWSFEKKRVLVQLHRFLWYAASSAALLPD